MEVMKTMKGEGSWLPLHQKELSHEAMKGLPTQNFKFYKNILQRMKIKKQRLKPRKAINYRSVIQEMLSETFEAGGKW